MALTHCFVVHYDRMLDRGEKLPSLQDWHVAENKWRAARYGLDALVITSRATEERLVTDEVRDLVAELSPLARELGCYDELQLVLEIIDTGAGYQRQRELFQQHGSWYPAVDATIAEMYR